jgi:glycosyltransferase involved in cell wall biosynthesis
MSRIEVVQFQRRAVPGVFSIERLFETVRSALPDEFEVRLQTNRFYSRGLWPRLLDAVRARQLAGRVNHVLGDVHYLTWFLPRQGTILTVHDCVSLERLRGPRRRLLWLLWYWLPLQRAEHVTVVSEYTRRELLRWVPRPRARLRVIPPPVPRGLERCPAPARGQRLRLLQVGTAENKNLLRVLEACQGLPVRLVIVGALDGPSRARLAALDLEFENRVELDADALAREYRACDALIFASTYEGFGLPILEAQRVGRPVITSRVCSMPEASGGAACLVDPFDVADIRRGIRRVLEDVAYCAELVERGFDNAARHAPERIAAAYAELYREAARAGAPERSVAATSLEAG